MNHLTSSILHSLHVAHPANNWVFSPASYLEAMSNLALCLKGENLAELIAAAPDIAQPQAIGLETYNYLLYSAEYRFSINEAILEALIAKQGELRSFVGAEVVDVVNKLVYEKTRGKISDLISRDDITEFTKFIILNCVYFKKEWVHEFEEDHYAYRQFKGTTKTVKAKFLYKQAWFKYHEGDGYDIVEIPYRDSEVCCYLIVPTTKSVFELFNSINEHMDKIDEVKNGLECNLTVPPFKVETTINGLAGLTKIAGVNKMFEWNREWSLVHWERLDPMAMMSVEKIVQKAYIDFTKKGTEAAAATAIICAMSGCCMNFAPPPPVKRIVADQPFVFVLARPQEPNKPLFVGVVNEMEGEPSDGSGSPFRAYDEGEILRQYSINVTGSNNL